MSALQTIPLDAIRVDGGTQMRAELNEAVVSEYAQMIRDGQDFPPIVVFLDGAKHWLGDGFHRFHAYRAAGAIEIEADVRTGARRDAILYSVGANASHGLRRTNADKRKAVETLLADVEWATWSDREIARRCAVDHKTVSALRPEKASGEIPQIDRPRFVERGGATYQQNTANIGKPVRVAVDGTAGSEPASGHPPRPASAEPSEALDGAYRRFIAITDDLATLDLTAVVTGIPLARDRAGLIGRVRSLLGQLEELDVLLGGASNA